MTKKKKIRHALQLDEVSARIAPQHKRSIRRRRWIPPPLFSVNVEYKDYGVNDLDEKICKAAGRKYTDGSGFSFSSHIRDLSFGFNRRVDAIACAKRISKLRGVKATVTGRVWP